MRTRRSNGRGRPILPRRRKKASGAPVGRASLVSDPPGASFRMIDNGNRPAELAPLARRTNGLPPEAPEQQDRLVLVTGGAGYIRGLLARRLLARGHPRRIPLHLYS